MRTHPLVALAVVAAAITTMTVFGQSVPLPAPIKKLRRPVPALAARPVATPASSSVPSWLTAPVASAADPSDDSASSPGLRRHVAAVATLERAR